MYLWSRRSRPCGRCRRRARARWWRRWWWRTSRAAWCWTAGSGPSGWRSAQSADLKDWMKNEDVCGKPEAKSSLVFFTSSDVRKRYFWCWGGWGGGVWHVTVTLEKERKWLLYSLCMSKKQRYEFRMVLPWSIGNNVFCVGSVNGDLIPPCHFKLILLINWNTSHNFSLNIVRFFISANLCLFVYVHLLHQWMPLKIINSCRLRVRASICWKKKNVSWYNRCYRNTLPTYFKMK